MSDDLIDQLRDLDRLHRALHGEAGPCGQAADEILRLRDSIRQLRYDVLIIKRGQRG